MTSMKTPIILADNMLLRELDGEKRTLRVVRNDGPAGYVWLFDIWKKRWPYPVDHATAIGFLTGDEPSSRIEYEDPWPPSIHGFGTRTATDKAEERRWRIVQLLVDDDGGRTVLFATSRSKLLKSISSEHAKPRSSLENLLMRYWQRGMTRDALRPDYEKCGGRGKRRTPRLGIKIGRPRSISPGVGASADEEMRKRLTIAAGYYLSSKNVTQKVALDDIIRRCYRVRSEEPGEKYKLLEGRPTDRQFRYFLDQNYSRSNRFRSRHGQKKFDLTARGLGGSGDQNTHGPGDIFQIDATIADIYLVSKLDRNRIVGRPTVYFVIDVWSRLITGLYVGFEGPSWVGAMMTLVNMVTPKVEFCAQYGIDIAEEEWPSHHAPRAIMADKGELASCGLGERIVDVLRIDIKNASTGRADLKAIVERRFNTIQAKFRPFVPGYVEKDQGERGVRDCRLDAKLTLREFTEIIIHSVLEHNSESITNIKSPAAMTTAGMQASPVERWQWGIGNRSGRLRTLAVEKVALNVMPRETARVTEKGIKFKGGYYTCETERNENWLFRARTKNTWTEEVCFDPRSLQKMYLLKTTLPGGFEACELMRPSQDLSDVSLFEYEEVSHAGKVVKAEGEERRQERRIRASEKIEQIVKQADKKAEAARDPGVSKKKRVADIRDNKLAEKALERPSETFDLSPEHNPPSLVPDAMDDQDDYEMEFLTNLQSTAKGNESEA
jgi:hypothetical protein